MLSVLALVGLTALGCQVPAEPGGGQLLPTLRVATPSQVASEATTQAGPVRHIDGDGLYLVGQDIEPGTYRTAGATQGRPDGCYWARRRDTSGETSGIVANGYGRGPATVTIAKGDKAFEVRGCQRWEAK
ncbi:hypothetical protein M8C13_04650 [Crossiella sp. SN42]|uniref:hypothetical protein n=1 Tax=Crossiella sp. SN42 TaxID=2944808 RepID=UPI00207D608E|nr:hypothetical protein [Crossiella sp. SN42]MCO1575049.1 hypothetical protein [Crossiella sp. SN42]